MKELEGVRTVSKTSVIITATNEAQDLAACLASVQHVADQIVLADVTKERFREMAKAFGAEYLPASDCDTIPEARNRALAKTSGEWILVLDADERLEPQDAAALSKHTSMPAVDFFSVGVRRYVNSMQIRTWESAARPNPVCTSEVLDSFPAYMNQVEPRLFRKDAIERFEETASDAAEVRFNGDARRACRASVRVHKIPTPCELSLAMRRRSGRMRKEAEPDNALAHFRLGLLEFEETQDFVTAIGHFRDACIANNSFGPGWLYTAKCLLKLGAYQKAEEACLRAEMSGLHAPMVAEVMGEAFYREGDFAGARASFVRAVRRAEKLQPYCVVTIARKLELADWRLKGASNPFQLRMLEEDARLHEKEHRKVATLIASKEKEQDLHEIEAALLSS